MEEDQKQVLRLLVDFVDKNYDQFTDFVEDNAERDIISDGTLSAALEDLKNIAIYSM